MKTLEQIGARNAADYARIFPGWQARRTENGVTVETRYFVSGRAGRSSAMRVTHTGAMGHLTKGDLVIAVDDQAWQDWYNAKRAQFPKFAVRKPRVGEVLHAARTECSLNTGVIIRDADATQVGCKRCLRILAD